MTTYTLAEAKANFSKVVDEVMLGHSALITKHGHPAAMMTPATAPVSTKRQLHGCLKKEFANWRMPDDFDQVMQEEIVALFEGDAL